MAEAACPHPGPENGVKGGPTSKLLIILAAALGTSVLSPKSRTTALSFPTFLRQQSAQGCGEGA